MDRERKFDSGIEQWLVNTTLGEYESYIQGRAIDHLEFEASLDMLECKRTEKDYDWMSDLFLPEFPSILLTDASNWANQYFQSRDFVEAKLDDVSKESKYKARAAARCINQTLNRRGLYHYQKYIRARTINALMGQVVILCEWVKNVREEQTGTKMKHIPAGVDEAGEPLFHAEAEPVMDTIIEADWFNYEVIDPRNVAFDTAYSYSLAQKNWVTICYQDTYEGLQLKANKLGYFNLDLLKEKITAQETESEKKTIKQNDPSTTSPLTPLSNIDLYLRMGKMWAIVGKRDEKGNPEEIKPGMNEAGEPLDGAELVETILVVAKHQAQRILIRFQPNPYRTKTGVSYKPVIRGLCYIHPTKDSGLSDSRYGRELQIAINDTMNMSVDRVKLATMPSFIGRKTALDDTAEFFIEPEHVIMVENPNEDLRELKISDNISGSLEQLGVLRSFMEQALNVYPTSMGKLPAASTTATAIADTSNKTNLRSNYKSLTFEYTFAAEFYWMILQMTWQFAEEKTAMKMLGDLAQFFDPEEDYVYSPVSSNVEMEYNKHKKLQIIDQFIGRVANIPNPNTPRLLNYLLSMAFELFNQEFPEFKNYLLDESAPQGDNGNQPKDMKNPPTSNQMGVPMSNAEQFARNM